MTKEPYWGASGDGGITYDKCTQALASQLMLENPSHAQLLKLACRFYSALMSAKNFVNIYIDRGILSETLLTRIDEATGEAALYDSENLYREFFRHAVDLLFDERHAYTGSGWCVCQECGVVLGRGRGGKSIEGKICGEVMPDPSCAGILRKYTWADLGRPELAE